MAWTAMLGVSVAAAQARRRIVGSRRGVYAAKSDAVMLLRRWDKTMAVLDAGTDTSSVECGLSWLRHIEYL
jgi:hypothetical protein